jgi:hypothetical protein
VKVLVEKDPEGNVIDKVYSFLKDDESHREDPFVNKDRAGPLQRLEPDFSKLMVFLTALFFFRSYVLTVLLFLTFFFVRTVAVLTFLSYLI